MERDTAAVQRRSWRVGALGVLEPDLSGFPPEAVLGPAFTPGWRSAITPQLFIRPLHPLRPVYGRSRCEGFSQENSTPGDT